MATPPPPPPEGPSFLKIALYLIGGAVLLVVVGIGLLAAACFGMSR